MPPGPGPWKPIETRMRTYVTDPADALMFAGRSLTHTDWMPDNVLISHGRAWLVDWAWAAPAQSWIDQGYWVIRLVANGHAIAEAETIAAQFPAYSAADPAHIAAFARANANMWNEIEAGRPVSWTQTMAASARTWAEHRQRTSSTF
jgi:thiamine kinase-like enzyme